MEVKMSAKTLDWRPGLPVCRCCFAEGCYKDISTEYFWMGKREVYSEMLTDTFDVTISFSQTGGPNSNSRLICEQCISKLRDASDFKRQVQECERAFQQHLAQPTSSVNFELPETSDREEVKLERVKLEAKLDDEDFDSHVGFPDDDDDDMDDEPLTKLASKVPKEESDILLKTLLLDDNKRLEKRKSTTKVKASPSKKIKKKETTKPSVSKPAQKTPAEKKKKDLDGCGDSAERRNAAVILRNSTAYPFQINGTSLKCCFCTHLFDDPSVFRSHCDAKHSNIDKSCIVSDSSQIRIDIFNLRCKLCDNNQTFSSLELLVRHLNDKHEFKIDNKSSFGLIPVKFDKDRYECVVCNKIFKGVVSLYRHSGTHFSRHVCDTCGRSYESIHGLARHIHACKEDRAGSYFCRFCRTSFANIQERMNHSRMANNYRCKPYKCKACVLGFLTWELKQVHLENVHGKEKRIFSCVECKKVFSKRIFLYRHFKVVHIKDLKCQYCDRTFATKRDLGNHTNAHLAERPHKCHVCDKGLATEKSLRAHLKIHDDSQKLPCPACGKLFVARSRLEDHILKHHPERSARKHCT